MSEAPNESLLPTGVEVPFADIEGALAGAGMEEGKRGAGYGLTASMVVVGPHPRLVEAARALSTLTDIGVRTILISYGTNPAPTVCVSEHTIALAGFVPHYVNNAIAALRLSSLPTVVWWRGGAEETLNGLATLADRLVLDAEDPREVWRRVHTFDTATSDLRWTRLTRWRALMAHFFDIPEVRAAAPSFRRLYIEGSDVHAARLFAAWLTSALQSSRLRVELRDTAGPSPIERVELGEGDQVLRLCLNGTATCVESEARVHGTGDASRIVSLGKQDLAALIGEELRIRSRDLSFERAVAAVEGIT